MRHVDSLQPPFSLIQREVGAAEIPWCAAARHRASLLQPDAVGHPDGALSAARVEELAADDWRRRSEIPIAELERNLALRDALKPIAERHGSNTGEVAVAWTLAWPGVTGAIVGARSPEQVDGWIGAASLQLSAQDLMDIANTITRIKPGAGPRNPLESRPTA